jgi:hypothetical protein
VRDARGILQLPPAQEDDAKKKLAEQETAALNAIRRGWKHLLLPQEPQPASPNAARGFDLELVALTNRGSDPLPLAQLAWKKCEDVVSSSPASASSTMISEAEFLAAANEIRESGNHPASDQDLKRQSAVWTRCRRCCSAGVNCSGS